ncbi:MAG: translation elongation factor Ts [Gaiellaceae bacterium]
MTEISAQLVKQLRDQTGAGMMDAKRALQEVEGDIEAARTLLREKGMATAGKRADRDTSEGEVLVTVSGRTGTIVAVGCETEPVSKNEDFLAFAEQVLEAVESGGESGHEALEEQRQELVGKIRENIVVRGAARLEAGEGESLAEYVHPPANKIGVLVQVKGENPAAARRLAMHISFARPRYATREAVPAEDIQSERELYGRTEEVLAKPEGVREKIVEGMLQKRFFGENVLADQPWIHDTGLTVAKALSAEGLELVDFRLFALG